MPIKGSVQCAWLDSKILGGNPAGVDIRRPLTVYLPPEVGKGDSQEFPVLYCLAPWTSAGRNMLDWRPFKESLPSRFERLVAEGKIPPCIVVCPDIYTEFGGTQYIDSTYFGSHGSYLVNEVFDHVEKSFPVKKGANHRGIFGRSSGGFGALRLALDFPGSVGAVACHSGDMGFDLLFYGDLVTLPNKLSRYEGGVLEFVEYTRKAAKLSSGDIHLLMLLGSAGFYSPNQESVLGFDLPIDLKTGEVQKDVWDRWLAHDPVRRINADTANALGKLGCLYVECGNRDQYNLVYGARQLHERFTEFGVDHTYKEFDDNHSGTDYRFDISLPAMLKAIS